MFSGSFTFFIKLKQNLTFSPLLGFFSKAWITASISLLCPKIEIYNVHQVTQKFSSNFFVIFCSTVRPREDALLTWIFLICADFSPILISTTPSPWISNMVLQRLQFKFLLTFLVKLMSVLYYKTLEGTWQKIRTLVWTIY